MKKSLLMVASVFALTLAVSANSYAQSANDYVRNTKTVPDLTISRWVHDPAEDSVQGEFVKEIYLNQSEGLVVYFEVRVRNGSREELFMLFGSRDVARGALKVDGKWHLAKGPLFDRSNNKLENDFKAGVIKDGQGKITAVKISLETLDGLKTLVVDLK